MSQSHRKNVFEFKVGTVTLSQPYEGKYSYETAAWYTNYALQPGTYDVFGTYERDYFSPERMKLTLSTRDIPGIIVSENTQSLWGGVPVGGNSGASREGKEMSEKIVINEYDLTTGKIKLELDTAVPYITVTKNDKGHSVINLDTEHPSWVELMKERDRHEFREKLRPLHAHHKDYYEIAQKSGLLADEVIDQAMDLNFNLYQFEIVINMDQHMRRELGYGVQESGVAIEEVSSRFKDKSGDMRDIEKDVLKELKDAHGLESNRPKGGSELNL